MILLWQYKSTPALASTPPESWPGDSPIELSKDGATIVMLAHPQCPCTRASVGELAQLMTQVRGRARAHVLFLRPADMPDDWEKTDLWRSAEAIPGVTPHTDVEGRGAALFGAVTSGATVVYGADGRLLFRGGITAARGHAGDNAGRSRIVSLLMTGSAERTDSPVFGCSLLD